LNEKLKKKRANTNKNYSKALPSRSTVTASSAATEVASTRTRAEKFADFTYKLFKQIEQLHPLKEQTIKQYTREDLILYIENPARYTSQLIDISNYMYNYSKLFQKIIDYYTDMALCRWTVDTQVKSVNFYSVNDKQLKKNYIAYIEKINRLNLAQDFNKILKRMFLEDCVFGYWLEENNSCSIYYFPYNWCSIKFTMNGLYCFAIDTRRLSQKDFDNLPKEIYKLVAKYRGKGGDEALCPIPIEKAVCYKFNNHFSYLYPPFISIVQAILDILDYKILNKTKSEMEAWGLIEMFMPTDEDGKLLIEDDIALDAVLKALEVIPEGVGLIPTPMKLAAVPMNQKASNDRDNVRDSLSQFNLEAGVPDSVLGSSTSGSELTKSIENDASLIYRILDQISAYINLKMKIEGFNYPSYEFRYSLLHITVFNEKEFQDKQLKAASSGAPNKMTWLASYDINPAITLGQAYVENNLFRDVFDNFTVLQTSYTQSTVASGDSGSSNGGRPSNESQGIELSPAGEQTVAIDGNDPDNRA
jgi:hypothetical protein